MAQQLISNMEDDLARAIRESLLEERSSNYLFEGLENISEEKQVSLLLKLSAQEAAAASNSIPAEFNTEPSSTGAYINSAPLATSTSNLFQEQLEVWRQTPLSERVSLVLNGDFDPGKLRAQPGRSSVSPSLSTSRGRGREDEEVKNSGSPRVPALNGDHEARLGARPRTKPRVNEAIPLGRSGSSLRLEDYRHSQLTEEEELLLALKLSDETSREERQKFSSPSVESSYRQPPAIKLASIYNPEKQQIVGGSRRLIVIDGCNVGHAHGHHKAFSFRGVLISVEFFQLKQHEVVVFLPQSRYNQASEEEKETMENLIQTNILVITPRKKLPDGRVLSSYDDLFIIKFASQRKGIIVSNDQYRDVRESHPEYREQIEERVLTFTWHEDTFMIPDDPLGRDGPTIEQFLSHS